jgi:hypothetical protein
VKASGLRRYFEKVDQSSPLFLHTPSRRKFRLGSTNADRLKSRALICNRCNSALTQPYDRAWQRLSESAAQLLDGQTNVSYIDLGRVFPIHRKQMAVDLQLYFVKLFSCRIVEHNVPIDVAPFANALREKRALESVYIALAVLPAGTKKRVAGVSA